MAFGWVLGLLRVLGIRRAADAVPVVVELGNAVADAVAPEEPATPLTHADVDWIESQVAAATSHKVNPPPGHRPLPPPVPRRKGKARP